MTVILKDAVPPIMEVAKLGYAAVAVIQKHYDRHDVLKRAEEVQSLPFGKTKPPEVETIDVMSI